MECDTFLNHFYLLYKSVKLVSWWKFLSLFYNVTTIFTVQRRRGLTDFLYTRVEERFATWLCIKFVCAWFPSPSVQLASDIPRSVNSLSENMTGGLRFPLPMGSSLKKSQWTTSSWPSRRPSNSCKMKTNLTATLEQKCLRQRESILNVNECIFTKTKSSVWTLCVLLFRYSIRFTLIFQLLWSWTCKMRKGELATG